MEKRLSVVLAGLVLSAGVGVVAEGCESSDTADAVACGGRRLRDDGVQRDGLHRGVQHGLHGGLHGGLLGRLRGLLGGLQRLRIGRLQQPASAERRARRRRWHERERHRRRRRRRHGVVRRPRPDHAFGALSLADDLNSMASPVHVRELLHDHIAPSAIQIRTYEFLNYYHINYPSPQVGLSPSSPNCSTPATRRRSTCRSRSAPGTSRRRAVLRRSRSFTKPPARLPAPASRERRPRRRRSRRASSRATS